jgi:hypothetical protein
VSKPWDNKIKRLLSECPQDFMDWLIRGAQFTGNRSQEFKSISLSLAFEANDDLDWLDRRFAMLRDILNNSPAFQHLRKIAREEGLEEGREEGREIGREEGRLKTSRFILLEFVQARFPELTPIAKERVEHIKKPETLERLTLKIGMAQTREEARDYLLDEGNL